MEHLGKSQRGGKKVYRFDTDQEQIANIVAMRRGGATLAAVGEAFGIGRERVRQIVAKWEAIEMKRQNIANSNQAVQEAEKLGGDALTVLMNARAMLTAKDQGSGRLHDVDQRIRSLLLHRWRVAVADRTAAARLQFLLYDDKTLEAVVSDRREPTWMKRQRVEVALRGWQSSQRIPRGGVAEGLRTMLFRFFEGPEPLIGTLKQLAEA